MTDYENGSEEDLLSANEAYLGSMTFLHTKRDTNLNVKHQAQLVKEYSHFHTISHLTFIAGFPVRWEENSIILLY